jgi:phosphocarrier protein HPr
MCGQKCPRYLMEMVTQDVEITNRKGLHARAASKLVQLATKYKSKIQLSRDGQVSDGKSILGVLVLAAHQGATLTIHVEGEDEQEAMAQLVALIQRKFDEGE